MKDRFPLGDWPIDWVAATLNDFPKFSRETRLFLGKVIGLGADHLLKKSDKAP